VRDVPSVLDIQEMMEILDIVDVLDVPQSIALKVIDGKTEVKINA